jgi:hypothetical protein
MESIHAYQSLIKLSPSERDLDTMYRLNWMNVRFSFDREPHVTLDEFEQL